MGSYVNLTIGGMEIDWGKNNSYVNHSKLFQPSDHTLLKTLEDDDEKYEVYGYRRVLRDVIPRLKLYGYNDYTIEKIFNQNKLYHAEHYPELNLTFEDFSRIISNITIVPKTNLDYGYDYDFGEFAREMLHRPEYEELNELLKSDNGRFAFFENLEPYAQLWLLSKNEANLDLFLEWHTGEIVENGWTNDIELFTGWHDSNSFLIITEGSSDTFIIRESIKLLSPQVQDFFRYIDMKESYPFTGTGNLYNFYQGLAKIGITNPCLVIFDNDTEGLEKHQKCLAVNAPGNLSTTTLPELPEFHLTETVGPGGAFIADVNGRAVSIELFLDLSFRTSKPPLVRWSNYNSYLGEYHGALEDKEFYIRQFKHALKNPTGYDFSKLEKLIDHICECCARLTGEALCIAE